MLISLLGATATALVGIAYFEQNPEAQLTDPEAIFIALGQIVFHPLVAGVILAAVLAAIMSTISSQLLVTSSALVEDLYKIAFPGAATEKRLVLFGRLAVLGVSVVAAGLAWNQSGTVLELVAYAWAGFGASFGPIILLSLYWKRLTAPGAIAGLITGAVTVVVWGNIDALSSQLYEIVPGFVLNLAVAALVSNATYRPEPEIEAEFDEAVRLLDAEAYAADAASR